MNNSKMSGVLAILACVTCAAPALAHVGYGSALYSGDGVYDPLTNTIGTGSYGPAASFTATAASNAGFLSGLDPYTLGNTHDVRFRYFTLSESSFVSFTIQGLPNGSGASTLNPGFSLYSGVVPASSHDGVGDNATIAGSPATSAYLATAPDFAAWSPFADVNDVRLGTAAGDLGNPTGWWGVFDSDGDWTTGNDGQWGSNPAAVNPPPADGVGPYLGNQGVPKIGTVEYLGISGADALGGASITDALGGTVFVPDADGVVDNMVSWSGVLGPGIYTLAIGGADPLAYLSLAEHVRCHASDSGCAALYTQDRLARSLTISSFTVASVPEPASLWMLCSGLAMAGALLVRRRRNGLAAGV